MSLITYSKRIVSTVDRDSENNEHMVVPCFFVFKDHKIFYLEQSHSLAFFI
jgi:hypothetical protein